jgi:hypothetical protein
MDLKGLTDKAKDLVEKRGGSDSLKRDAAELRKIADGPGSLGDKAKAAVAAIKDPGGDQAEAPSAEATTPAEPAAGDEKAHRKQHDEREDAGREGDGAHGHKGHGRRRNERGRDGDPGV